MVFCCLLHQTGSFSTISPMFHDFRRLNVKNVDNIRSSKRECGRSMEMNIMSRFMRVGRAWTNWLLNRLEQPERILDQTVVDMEQELIKIRQSYAEICATQKRAEKRREIFVQKDVDWLRRAHLALEVGDEELAKEALSARQLQLDHVSTIDKQMTTQKSAIDKLENAMTKLSLKIKDTKIEKDALVSRARTAKTSMRVNDMLSTVTGSTSMDAFEKMKTKVEQLEAESEIAFEFAETNNRISGHLENKFRKIEKRIPIDDQLALLKKQLPDRFIKSSSSTMALPPTVDVEFKRLQTKNRNE